MARRRFTAAYKLRVLNDLEGCQHAGDRAALLRREDLSWSLVSKWRAARDAAVAEALAPKKRGPKVKRDLDALLARIEELDELAERLGAENGVLRSELERLQLENHELRTRLLGTHVLSRLPDSSGSERADP